MSYIFCNFELLPNKFLYLVLSHSFFLSITYFIYVTIFLFIIASSFLSALHLLVDEDQVLFLLVCLVGFLLHVIYHILNGLHNNIFFTWLSMEQLLPCKFSCLYKSLALRYQYIPFSCLMISKRHDGFVFTIDSIFKISVSARASLIHVFLVKCIQLLVGFYYSFYSLV